MGRYLDLAKGKDFRERESIPQKGIKSSESSFSLSEAHPQNLNSLFRGTTKTTETTKGPTTPPPGTQETEVAWRVKAMRPQLPSSGAIPFLVARKVTWEKDRCLSCGDSLAREQRVRCFPCARAARLVISETQTQRC